MQETFGAVTTEVEPDCCGRSFPIGTCKRCYGVGFYNTSVDHRPVTQSCPDCRTGRLRQLREEFQAKRDEWLDREHEVHGYDCTVEPPVTVTGVWRHRDGPAGQMTVEDWAALRSFFGGYKPIKESAQRYIIARDFSEFDRKKALMVWKLQNGGAL